jgi:drug/metabolite transporter (DMT)-like permease
MRLSPYEAAAIALLGSLVLSLGMSLQKRYIGWIGRPAECPPTIERRRKGRVYRDFGLWFFGFMLQNSVPVFQYFALMSLSTHVVAAVSGASVAFTAILARLFLRERLGRWRLAWTIILFVAIAAAGVFGESGSSGAEAFSMAALYVFLGLPLAMGIALLAARKRHRGPRLAAVLAASSGCLGGFMLFPLRAIQFAASPGIPGWLSSPFLYAYLGAGISSFVLLQTAYKDGEMASVAPAYYGTQVLWPAIGSLFVFGAAFLPAQAAAFALVAVCVALIAGAPPALSPPMDGPRRESPTGKQRNDN